MEDFACPKSMDHMKNAGLPEEILKIIKGIFMKNAGLPEEILGIIKADVPEEILRIIKEMLMKNADLPEEILGIIKADLPEDILGIIKVMFMDKLSSFDDYLRFSEVCSSFRSFAREERYYQKLWVMLPNKPGEKVRPFYSLLENKIYYVKLPKLARRSLCCGSYEGWLIMSHKTRGNFMYNPITRLRARLPTPRIKHESPVGERSHTYRHYIKRFPYFVTKVVVSNVPVFSSSISTSTHSSSFLAAAAVTENYNLLVTCLPSLDKKWHHFCPLTLKNKGELISPISDYDTDDYDESDGEEEEQKDEKESQEEEEEEDDDMS